MDNCEPHIPHVSVKIDENDVFKGADSILDVIRPEWIKDRINFKLFTDGITNKLVGCFYDGSVQEVVLVRVYGNKTDLLINRSDETRNIKLLHKAGYAPRLFATFINGLAYEFVPGCILTVDSVRLPAVWKLVAKQMALMHRVECDSSVPKQASLWEKTMKFAKNIPKCYTDSEKQNRFTELILPVSALLTEFENLYSVLKMLGSPIVFAHNDLLLGNVIYNESLNKVTFIDYEYASYNHQAFDIGNHFAEFVGINIDDYSRYPSKQFQMAWLREYLLTYNNVAEVNSDELDTLYSQVNKFSLASHLFWGLWALIQAENSSIDFDFIGYAATRIKEYFDKKEGFLSIDLES